MAMVANIYPGQGSQKPRMGLDLLESFPETAKPVFSTAKELLEVDIEALCTTGSAEELRRTEIAQPAIFTISWILHCVLGASAVPPPRFVAGHSLGEYTALAAAGVLDWTDALVLVRRRGELMAGVSETNPGAMIAVIGIDAQIVSELCARASESAGTVVEIANLNDDEQTVVAGTVAGVEALREVLSQADIPEYRWVPLDVGAPFHCSLMSSIEEEFAGLLDATSFKDPQVRVFGNVTAQPISSASDARDVLRRQLAGTVRWRDLIREMVGEGVDTFIEVGPGRVLSGICRRSFPTLGVHSVSDARRAAKVVATFSQAPSASGV